MNGEQNVCVSVCGCRSWITFRADSSCKRVDRRLRLVRLQSPAHCVAASVAGLAGPLIQSPGSLAVATSLASTLLGNACYVQHHPTCGMHRCSATAKSPSAIIQDIWAELCSSRTPDYKAEKTAQSSTATVKIRPAGRSCVQNRCWLVGGRARTGLRYYVDLLVRDASLLETPSSLQHGYRSVT